MSKILPSTLGALCLSFLPAAAGEASFGLQAHLALPEGKAGDSDHLDRRLGFGAGFQVPIDFGAGQVLRPRLDYMTFSRDRDGLAYDLKALTLLLDYNHYVAGERDGLYLIGGIGVNSTRREVTVPGILAPVTLSGSTTGLCYNLGLGYAFTPNLAVELKYQASKLGEIHSDRGWFQERGYTANALVGSLSFTF